MLKVDLTAYGGRAYFATEFIPSGTTILIDTPSVSTIYDDFKKEVCVYCFAYNGGSNLKHIVGESSRACSATCKEKFLSLYRAQKIQQLWDKIQRYKKQLGDEMNYDLLRFCASAVVLESQSPQIFAEVLTLQDDLEVVTDTERNSARDVTRALATLISKPNCNRPNLVNEMLGRSKCNCFGIWEQQDDGTSFPESEMFGYALYTKSSFFNHSCSPNVAKLRVAREMTFVTSTDIAQGDELTITYLGDRDYTNVVERRAALKEWGFVCMCSLCLAQSSKATQ